VAVVDNKVDSEEAAMKTKANEQDTKFDEEVKKLEEENAKISGFKKLEPYNKPVYLIVVATLGAIINGSAQPILGVVFAKMLSLLSLPLWYLE
jgi:hypothetical protein